MEVGIKQNYHKANHNFDNISKNCNGSWHKTNVSKTSLTPNGSWHKTKVYMHFIKAAWNCHGIGHETKSIWFSSIHTKTAMDVDIKQSEYEFK